MSVEEVVLVVMALAGGRADAAGGGGKRAGGCLRDSTSSSAFLSEKLACGRSEGASESGLPSFTRGEGICAADVQTCRRANVQTCRRRPIRALTWLGMLR